MSPIALFVYKRPEHSKKVLEALQRNAEAIDSELFVFSDGPKDSSDIAGVQDTRNVIRNITGFKKVYLIESSDNQGLAKSIISGVSNVLASNNTVIVLEDDLIVSEHFLGFMNTALAKYNDIYSVDAIHAYTYPTYQNLPDQYFLKSPGCWGWATWKRAWKKFNPNASDLYHQILSRNLGSEFDYNNSYPYCKMLLDQANGEIDSWAIRWMASCFLGEGLTLNVGKSLVRNIGTDGSGSNTGDTTSFDVDISNERVVFSDIEIVQSSYATEHISAYYKKINAKKGILKKVLNRVLKVLT